MLEKLISIYPPLSFFSGALAKSRCKVFLVGGALRDYYLNRQGKDLDFAVDKGAIALARQLARSLKASFVLLDQEHGCARLVKKINEEIWTFDLSDWRSQSIKEDLALRDFTINAMALEMGKGDAQLLDDQGARTDLKRKIVRMVHPKVFEDDPLRLLRAYSLSSTLGFKIEAKTRGQIKKDAHLIAPVASERIREEIFKVLSSPHAFETLVDMDKIGLLSKVMPQITVMYKVHQGGYHHLDVWQHSLEVLHMLENIVIDFKNDEHIKQYLDETIGGNHSRLALLKMAALLHDIGKPQTRKVEGKRTSFHGHEHVGERITRQLCKQLKLTIKEQYFLENAVRMHLRPGYLSNFKKPSEKAIFRYMRDTKTEAASLAILAMADQASTRGPLTTQAKHKHHTKICKMIIERFFAIKDEKPKQRLITGKDLIKTLKLKPSPLFGKILTVIEEAAALGKISTKSEAIIMARKLSKEK